MLRRTIYLSRLILVASVSVVSLAAQRTQVAPKESFVLERGRAGQFEIGMTVDELYKVAGREQVRPATSHRGAESRPAMDVRIPGFTAGPALRVSLDRICSSPAAWWIEVHDPRFRTKNGLGVGSTLGDLRRMYPNAKVVGIDTDDGAHVAINELGLWFELELAVSFTDSTRVVTVSVLPQTASVKARRCPDQLR
jgi:hypothetical protein